MFMRLALLAALSWMAGMTEPLVTVLGHGFSGRDLILILGGAFLRGIDVLRLEKPGIPDYRELNARLMAATGWQVRWKEVSKQPTCGTCGISPVRSSRPWVGRML